MGRAKDEEAGGGKAAAAPDKDEDGERSASELTDAPGAPPASRRGERERDWHRLLALGIAALMLFPFLAKSGIWDPYELDAADLARRIALPRLRRAPSSTLPGAANVLPTLTDLRMGELPFTSMARRLQALRPARLDGAPPLALWGFAGVAVLYEPLARLVDRRAGLYAAIALVTMPLYFMQARTMLGDIVTMSALTIAFCGLAGAMLDARATARVARRRLAVGLAAGFCRGYLVARAPLHRDVAVPALGVGTRPGSRPRGQARGPAARRDGVGRRGRGFGGGRHARRRALVGARARARPARPLRRHARRAALARPSAS